MNFSISARPDCILCGSDKTVLREETAMAAALNRRTDTPTVLTLRPGGHTYAVWRAALRSSLLSPAIARARCGSITSSTNWRRSRRGTTP